MLLNMQGQYTAAQMQAYQQQLQMRYQQQQMTAQPRQQQNQQTMLSNTWLNQQPQQQNSGPFNGYTNTSGDQDAGQQEGWSILDYLQDDI